MVVRFAIQYVLVIVVLVLALCSSDPCTDGTSGCDQYATCTPQGTSYTCACRTGYKGNGTYCYLDIPALEPGKCKERVEFQCLDGTCIDVSKLRNGDKDCSEDEDEACHAESGRIRCDFLCVSPDDIEQQCLERKYKLYCTYFGKTPYFMCKDQRKCIPQNWVNDGMCTCDDCSDEYPTTTSSTSTKPPPPPPPPPMQQPSPPPSSPPEIPPTQQPQPPPPTPPVQQSPPPPATPPTDQPPPPSATPPIQRPPPPPATPPTQQPPPPSPPSPATPPTQQPPPLSPPATPPTQQPAPPPPPATPSMQQSSPLPPPQPPATQQRSPSPLPPPLVTPSVKQPSSPPPSPPPLATTPLQQRSPPPPPASPLTQQPSPPPTQLPPVTPPVQQPSSPLPPPPRMTTAPFQQRSPPMPLSTTAKPPQAPSSSSPTVTKPTTPTATPVTAKSLPSPPSPVVTPSVSASKTQQIPPPSAVSTPAKATSPPDTPSATPAPKIKPPSSTPPSQTVAPTPAKVPPMAKLPAATPSPPQQQPSSAAKIPPQNPPSAATSAPSSRPADAPLPAQTVATPVKAAPAPGSAQVASTPAPAAPEKAASVRAAPSATASADDAAMEKCWSEKAAFAKTRMEEGKSAVCPCQGYLMPNETKHCSPDNVVVLQLTTSQICNFGLDFAKFNKLLTDPTSQKFKEMAEMIVTGLVDIINGSSSLKGTVTQVCVAAVPMRSGSVVTTVNVQTNSTSPTATGQALNTAISDNGGKVGQSGLMSPSDAIADANECTMGGTECDQKATCTNTYGGYTCACKDGYSDISRNRQRTGSACTDSSSCQSNLYIGSKCVGIGWVVAFGLLCAALLLLSLLLLCCLCCPGCRSRYLKGSAVGTDQIMKSTVHRQTQTEDDVPNDIYSNEQNRQAQVSMSPNQEELDWDTRSAWPDSMAAAHGSTALRRNRGLMSPQEIELAHHPNGSRSIQSANGRASAEDMNGYMTEPTPAVPSEVERRRRLKVRKAELQESLPIVQPVPLNTINRPPTAMTSVESDGALHRRYTGPGTVSGAEPRRRNSESDAMDITPPNSIPPSPRRSRSRYRPRTGKAPPHWKVWSTRPGYFGQEHMIFDD